MGRMDIVVPNADCSPDFQTGTSPRPRENMEHVVEYGIARAYFARYATVFAVRTAVQD
jgi:hypothetical protein